MPRWFWMTCFPNLIVYHEESIVVVLAFIDNNRIVLLIETLLFIVTCLCGTRLGQRLASLFLGSDDTVAPLVEGVDTTGTVPFVL